MIERRIGNMIVLVLLALVGCGGPKLSYNDRVEGIVKLDGKPLAGVHVDFVPDGDLPVRPDYARGHTDENGHYELIRDSGVQGGFIGIHRVVVVRGRENGNRDGEDADSEVPPVAQASVDRRPIPKQYQGISTTPLRVQITPDQHTYDLELQSETRR